MTIVSPKGTGEARTRVAALSAMQSGRLMVYAVRTKAGFIKIGASIDVAERVRHVGGCVEILAVRFGTRADELAIHRRLKPHAARGREYYHPAPEVLAVVNDMRQDFGLPPKAA